MFAIEINFLTGRYVATSHYNRRLPEWPPHPARLFSALVAEWAVEQDPTERQALEWLEAQPPPSITASDELPRKVVKHFVPVNDASVVKLSAYFNKLGRLKKQLQNYWSEIEASEGEITSKVEKIQDKINKELDVTNLVSEPSSTNPKSAGQMLPEGRTKQERFFPSVKPAEPRVIFTWHATPQPDMSELLDVMLKRVTRLGHSSSLVSCRVRIDPPDATLEPAEVGKSIRGVSQGQLENLERKFQEHNGIKPRSLPYAEIRYREAKEPAPDVLRPNTVGDWQIFAFGPHSRAVPSTQTVTITKVFRSAIFHHAQDPLPEGLTGHKLDGTPIKLPHVGFYALPWVGYEHADGRVMGLALNIPNSLDKSTVNAAYRAINNWEQGRGPNALNLNFGRNGSLSMQRLTTTSELVTLRKSRWFGKAKKWGTATPIALPTHPGQLTRGKAETRSRAWQRAEEAVAKSCLHVGLPEPKNVAVSLMPFMHGVRPAPQFPAFSQTGADGNEVCRKLLHAVIEFDVLISGPLVLGAGRFLGLGLMCPLANKKESPNNGATKADGRKSSGKKS